MKRKELRGAIRKTDVVKVYSKTLGIYVQVNKTKLIATLENELHKDAEWPNYYFNTSVETGKTILVIN
jgi:hypothetical protein